MATLGTGDGHIVLINAFTVDPDKAGGCLKRPGFVSANLHVSGGRRHLANNAQRRGQADIDAVIQDDQACAYVERAAKVATCFEPIPYTLRDTRAAGSSR